MERADLEILSADGRVLRVGDVVEGDFTFAGGRGVCLGPHEIVQSEGGTITFRPVEARFSVAVSDVVARPTVYHAGLNRAQRRALRRMR